MSLQRIQQLKSRPKDEKDVKRDTKSTNPKQEDKNIKKDGQDVTKPIKIAINSGVEKQAKQPSRKPSEADPIPASTKIAANTVEAAKSRADLRSKCLKKADGLVRKSLPVILKTQSSQTVKPDRGMSNQRNTPQSPAQPTPEHKNEPKERIKKTDLGEQTKSSLKLHHKATEVPPNLAEPEIGKPLLPQLGDVEENPLSPADQISPAIAVTRTCTTQSQSEDVGYGIKSVTALVIPISITIILVISMQKIIDQGDVTPITPLAKGPSWNFVNNATEVAKKVSEAAESDEKKEAGFFDNMDTQTIIQFVILIAAIPVLTVVILCLYKAGCTKCLTGYLFVVMFVVLTGVTDTSLLVILQGVDVCVDFISVAFLLVNYAVLGVIVLFYKGPLLTLQMYQIAYSMTIARFFLKSLHVAFAWILLVALVIWDCIAVLPSWGPLRILVETAHERGDTLMPAMIYSTTAVWIPQLLSQRAKDKQNRKRCTGVTDTNTRHADNANSTDVLATDDGDSYDEAIEEIRTLNRTIEPTSSQDAFFSPNNQLTIDYNIFRSSHDGLTSDQNPIVFEQEGINQSHRLQIDLAESNNFDDGLSTSQSHEIPTTTAGVFEIEKLVNQKNFKIQKQCPNPEFDDSIYHLLPDPDRMSSGKDKKQKGKNEKDKALATKDKKEKATKKTKTKGANTVEQESKAKDVKKVDASDKSDDEEKGPKLGLGDFIFYSILVILALDSTDWNMVVACYWCVIAGLIGTILILIIKKKPLPALPISLTLGVALYFGTKFLISPFVDALQENQAFI